jgi:hypothetical protein
MKTTSVSENTAFEKMTDFMDRNPGLVSMVLIVTMVIVAGFIG